MKSLFEKVKAKLKAFHDKVRASSAYQLAKKVVNKIMSFFDSDLS
jgi:hypothetical protein